MRWIKYILLFLVVIVLLGGFYVYRQAMARLAPRPSMLDTPTTIIGFNHIGISVRDMDTMLDFYQSATDYEILNDVTISDNPAYNRLYGADSLTVRRVSLGGPNMLLELSEFERNKANSISKMPPQGPGMTHTCFQSHPDRTTYDSFTRAGAEVLTRANTPVDGLGVNYTYVYDPEGNMVELEEMNWTLLSLHIGKKWAKENAPWMTQVAIMTPDLMSLVDFYKTVLGIEPYRVWSLGPHPNLDAIIDHDSVLIESAWFGMDTQGKKMELMQYVNPQTQEVVITRQTTELGYSYSFEVGDIDQEYQRLSKAGVTFISSPQELDDFIEVLARDIDGNIFSLRQIKDPNSPLSLSNM